MSKTASKLVFSSGLKELRILLCDTSKSSKGAREFVEKHYPLLKAANPQLPILIRECNGIQPQVYARYQFGKEISASLSNESVEGVYKQILHRLNQSSLGLRNNNRDSKELNL